MEFLLNLLATILTIILGLLICLPVFGFIYLLFRGKGSDWPRIWRD